MRIRESWRLLYQCARCAALDFFYLEQVVLEQSGLRPVLNERVQVLKRHDYDSQVVKGALYRCLLDDRVGHGTAHLMHRLGCEQSLLDLI